MDGKNSRPEPAKRARTHYGSSRNGCARCKQRRVRCDELHPACDRCTRAGLDCPGFAPRLRWSSKHEKFPAPAMPETVSVTIEAMNVGESGAVAKAKPRAKPDAKPDAKPVPPQSPPNLTPASTVLAVDPPAVVQPVQQALPAPDVRETRAEQAWPDSFEQLFPISPGSFDFFADVLESPHAADLLPATSPHPVSSAAVAVDESRHPVVQAALALEEIASLSEEEILDETAVPPRQLDRPKKKRRHRSSSTSLAGPAISLASDASHATLFPQTSAPSLPATVSSDVSTGLVAFYFKETARIFSCFDSRMNPFRTAVVRVWTSSRLIYCTIQSMAADCLTNDFPHLHAVSRRLRQEAVQHLMAAPTLNLHVMLAMLMLGGTASWHEPADLGVPLFNFLASHLAAALPSTLSSTASLEPLEDDAGGGVDRRNYLFFYESMLYWEMLLAFVVDSQSEEDTDEDVRSANTGGHLSKLHRSLADTYTCMPPSPSKAKASANARIKLAHLKHPLSVIAQPLQQPASPPSSADSPCSASSLSCPLSPPSLASLASQQSVPSPPTAPTAFGPVPPQRVPHPWTGFAADTQRLVQQVGRLIRKQRKSTFSHAFPSTAHIEQMQRDMAAARDLENRLTAIVHPEEDAVTDTGDSSTPVWHLLALAEIIRAVGLVQLYHVFPDLLRQRLQLQLGSGRDDGGEAEAGTDDAALSAWLTTFTLRTLDRMRTIPLESGTRDFQPFLLVSLSSELRMRVRDDGVGEKRDGRNTRDTRDARDEAGFLGLGADIDLRDVEVMRARGFIQSRLTSFVHVLPPRPMRVCLQIVQETWDRMDQQSSAEAQAGIYWMDVMMENGWETTMA